MAITGIEYSIIRRIRDLAKLPLRGDILELGESVWYGDVPINALAQDIYAYGLENEREAIFRKLNDIIEKKPDSYPFDIAKIWYQTFFHATPSLMIDQNGPNALKLDLNSRIELNKQYDIVINFGTAEHIFNVYQFFENIHRWTKVGGYMIHSLPFSGWYDHGFYNFNPTFIWDLARSNTYTNLTTVNAVLNPLKFLQLDTREKAIEHFGANPIPKDSLIYSIMTKDKDTSFRTPQQYIYDELENSELASSA